MSSERLKIIHANLVRLVETAIGIYPHQANTVLLEKILNETIHNPKLMYLGSKYNNNLGDQAIYHFRISSRRILILDYE